MPFQTTKTMMMSGLIEKFLWLADKNCLGGPGRGALKIYLKFGVRGIDRLSEL